MMRSRNPISFFVVLGAGMLMRDSALADASTSVVSLDDQTILDLAKPMLDAIMSGHYLATTALAVVFIVALAKRYAPGHVGVFLQSDIGGALAAFLASLAGALATALLAGASPSWSIVKAAGGVAFVATGGYALLKKLVVPHLQSFANTYAWARPILSVVMWVFDKSANPAWAEAARKGNDAVADNPGQGAAVILGQPEKF